MKGMSVSTLLAPAVRASTTQGLDLSVKEFVGDAVVLLDTLGDTGSGTNPTWNVKLQHSHDVAAGDSYLVEGAVDVPLRHDTADNIKLAAAFTTAAAGSVKYIYLMLKRLGAIAAGKKIQVGLYTNSTADPGTLIGNASSDVEALDISTTYGWVKFTLPVPVDLSISTVYHVVLTGDYDVSQTVRILWRAKTLGSGGNVSIYDAAWAQTATQSFEFKNEQYTFADVTGAAFTEVTTTALTEMKRVHCQYLRDYVRAYATLGGTNTPEYISSVNFLGVKKRVV